MKTKFKIIISVVIFVLITSLFSCSYGPDYTYKWKLGIVYANGDIDTIECQLNSYKGNECNLILSSINEPCLFITCGSIDKPVACGIRKYKILNFEKTLLNKN